jgi:hypothetical protein
MSHRVQLQRRAITIVLGLASTGAGAGADLGVPDQARERGLRLGVSANPSLFSEITKKTTFEQIKPDYDHYVGGGGAVTLSYSYGLDTEILLSAFAEPASSSAGLVLPIGGRAGVRTDFTRHLFGGLGFSAGYLSTPDEPAVAPLIYEPRSSLFIAPDLELFGLRLGEDLAFEVSLRARLMFGTQEDLAGQVYAPVFFSPVLNAGWFVGL